MAIRMSTLAAVVLFAAVAVKAADYCAGPGAYHLSCYGAKVTMAAAAAAKTECFGAASTPACAAALVNAPAGTGGCPTPVLYKFATAACRDAYQAAEKSTAACAQYKAAGLGDAANRATATSSADYVC